MTTATDRAMNMEITMDMAIAMTVTSNMAMHLTMTMPMALMLMYVYTPPTAGSAADGIVILPHRLGVLAMVSLYSPIAGSALLGGR